MKNLEKFKEELIKQALLMSYDRAKTLMENENSIGLKPLLLEADNDEIPTLASIYSETSAVPQGICKKGYAQTSTQEIRNLLKSNGNLPLSVNLKGFILNKKGYEKFHTSSGDVTIDKNFYRPSKYKIEGFKGMPDEIICANANSDLIMSYSSEINKQKLEKGLVTANVDQQKRQIEKKRKERCRKKRGKGEKIPDSYEDYKDRGLSVALDSATCPGRDAYEIINFQIKGDGSWFSSWGTDENAIIDALRRLQTKEDYEELLFWIYKEHPDFRHATVIQWIQFNEFSTASESSRYEEDGLGFGRINVSPLTDWLQDVGNDDYLKSIERILKRFNSDESFSFESTFNDDFYTATFKKILPPFAREALHVVLPLVALALTITPGAQSAAGYLWGMSVTRIAAFALEVVDAAVYKFVDKDDYMAGLALIFAIAGPFVEGFGTLVKLHGKSLLKNLAKGATLTDEQIELLVYTTSNMPKLLKATKVGMRMNEVVKLIMRIKTVPELYMVTSWLVKKGLVPLNFVKEAGLMIGGSFLSWELINEKFTKYCNTMPLKMLEKSEYYILQKIGSLGPYLQPYSVPCSEIMEKNAKAEVVKKLKSIPGKLKLFFDAMEKNGVSFSIKQKDEKLPDVIMIQVLLEYLGFEGAILNRKKINIEVKDKKIIVKDNTLLSKVSLYSVTGRLLKTMDVKNIKDKSEPFNSPYGQPLSNQPMILKVTDTEGNTETKKIFYGAGWVYGGQVTSFQSLKWGYYDMFTEAMVKEFQKKYSLKQDGVCGKGTISKMNQILKTIGDNAKMFIPEDFKFTQKEYDIMKEQAKKNLDEKIKTMDKETKELVKTMNKNNVEETRKKTIKAASDVIYNYDIVFGDMSDKGTEEINKLDPSELFNTEVSKTDSTWIKK